MKKLLKKIVNLIGGDRKIYVVYPLKLFNKHLRNLSAFTHKIQQLADWGIPPIPEWHDHHLDIYYQWPAQRNPLWLERGIFNVLALKEDANVLELCCGDGFNAYHFYSIKARQILSVDFDISAINHAKKTNVYNNIEFQLCDIRHNIPEGMFDNIIWDAAMEHFTEQEIILIMQTIKKRLHKNGILSGYTLVEKSNGKHLVHHEYEFKSKSDLLRFFTPYFKNVRVFETIYPTRHNLYFYASDAILPFDTTWPSQVISNRMQSEI